MKKFYGRLYENPKTDPFYYMMTLSIPKLPAIF